jgi:hypothetical protein
MVSVNLLHSEVIITGGPQLKVKLMAEKLLTQPLTEINTRGRNKKKMFLGSRAWPAREADNLTAICEPVV